MVFNSIDFKDSESGFLVVMSPDHHARHMGQAYIFSKLYNNLLSNGIIYIELRTPSTFNEVAVKSLEVASDGLIKVEVFESPTIATPGTNQVPLIQRNRRVTNSAQTTIFDNATGVTGGTLLRIGIFGEGGNRATSSMAPDETGWSLKNNTTYVYKLTNIANQTAVNTFINGFLFEINR